ncbi:MAG TPA: universal stress protein [Gemmatimonadales bacterium]|nr:universal stress protein [Gemmatimonadales bacterium]
MPPADLPQPLNSIFHPSDFSESSEVAFAHALKIALLTHADLNILHVREAPGETWADFPGVRQMLERWHVLPPGSPRSAVPALGIDVTKVLSKESDPVTASLRYIERNPTDLIVLATSQHEGRARWLSNAVAEPLARESGLMTLFIPPGVGGFVSRSDGSVSLRSILIPVAGDPSPRVAVEAARRVASGLGREDVAFTALYVGAPADMPALAFAPRSGWSWRAMTGQGDIVQTILAVAGECAADLIVMATRGHQGFLDALRGSTTERVLRHARCPLLAVPAGG